MSAFRKFTEDLKDSKDPISFFNDIAIAGVFNHDLRFNAALKKTWSCIQIAFFISAALPAYFPVRARVNPVQLFFLQDLPAH